MAYFTQSRHPLLWELFQFWVGGTVDKRRLCLLEWSGEHRVLEVGCSVGNLSPAFADRPGVDYVGLDIDPAAIARAQRRFAATPNVRFLREDLREYARRGALHDYVMLAGLCHHLSDADCLETLSAARTVLAPGGKLVVIDPLWPRADDSWFLHWFVKLEQGEFVRSGDELRSLLKRAGDFELAEAGEHLIGATPIHRPICARFGVYTLSPTGNPPRPYFTGADGEGMGSLAGRPPPPRL